MGLIFDMDGVLINSNAAHLQSWRKIAKESRVDFPDELFWRTFGMTSEYIVETYWPGADTPEAVADIVERKETAFRESIVEHVVPIEGAFDFITYLADRGVRMAVGSSAPRINVEYVLDWMKIRPFFGECVTAGDEVHRGKPDPEIFLKSAEKIGDAPEKCVVIDDSRSGVLAGRAAGMTTIGFFSQGHRAEEYEQANMVVHSFDELTSAMKIGSEGELFF